MRASQTRNLLHVSRGRRLALRNAELYPPTICDLGEAGGRAVLQDITSIVSEQGLAAAVGAGFGRVSFCHASHSMSTEKPKMKSRMSLCVSIIRA